MKKILLLLMTLLLNACANQAPNYYLLAAQSNVVKAKNLDIIILLKPIIVSDYLANSGVGIQDQNSLIFSQVNLWAGSLRSELNSSAIKSLNGYNKYPIIKQEHLYNGQAITYLLEIQVDSFNAVQPDTVLIAGNYRIYDSKNNLLAIETYKRQKQLQQHTDFKSITSGLNNLWNEQLQDISSKLTLIIDKNHTKK